jgi:serine/threonine protein phosphatase PrpC
MGRDRVYGLAMSRAFGNKFLKLVTAEEEQGENPDKPWKASLVIAEPEISCVAISDTDEFLLLATDGLFHGMRSTEVIDVARRELITLRGDPKEAALRLLDHASQTPNYS